MQGLKKKTKKLKPIHPRNKIKRQMLHDASCVIEENVMDKILEALPANNDNLNVLHKPGTNTFTLK